MDHPLLISLIMKVAHVLSVKRTQHVNGSVAVVKNYIAVKTVLKVITRSAETPDLLPDLNS